MKVKDIMTSPVHTISYDATISQAAQKMETFDVGVLPVKKDGKIVGMITDRDIILRVTAQDLDPQKTTVDNAMTSYIISCRANDDVEEAAELMEENHVHRLLVFENDKAVGILSIGDVARKIEDDHIVHEVLREVSEPIKISYT
jgi:CBS domain-containing protein